ncbi:MAG: hypothetical protein KDB37_15625 [Ilumatobacter sp.]|nr:hypothetical protein [Ilumatobacter sp.]
MGDTGEMFQHLPFPFEGRTFPRRLGAVVQRTVLSGEAPAREVVHTPDGSWLVGDGINDPNEPDACVATHIWHAIDRNSSMTELSDLPPGHIATRSGPGDHWTVSPLQWSNEP